MRDIRAVKDSLRKKNKDIRRKISKNKKLSMDFEIQQKVLSLNCYDQEDILFTYLSKEIEVDTLNIVKLAHLSNKKIAVPKCITETLNMEFYLIKSAEDLTLGAFNVFEPIPEKCEQVKDFSHGICIVPGLSFDSRGFRLGYGKGYYDRFLAKFKGTTVGLCYNCCTQVRLPHGRYDRPVDILVTDKYIRYHNKRRANF